MSDERADHMDLDPIWDEQLMTALDVWNKRQDAWKPFKRYEDLELDERIEVEGVVYELFSR